ncbi:MAG: hypothetical protein F6K63_24175 [Moorea sp. SIO1G6]|nr:hypothetical protein [Moorena sp. SIO1G6]NET67312.1 hypothetical protein [Moorena sp. SIO1G6]
MITSQHHDKFGWFKDDPTFDDLQAEIAAYRQEIDQEILILPILSPDCL